MSTPAGVLPFKAVRCQVCGEETTPDEQHWCKVAPVAFKALLENAAASFVLIDTIAHPLNPLIAMPGQQRPRLNLNILAGTVKRLVELGILTTGKLETEQ